MQKGELIAIGGAYVDINVPDFPLTGSGLQLETEVVGKDYMLEPGGSAVNFARLCASLEVPTAFVGKVGEDELGKTLADLLLKAGVKPSLVVSADVSTNIGFNMINADGKSIMVVAGTANQALTADEVYAQASKQISQSSYLFLGGCFKLKKLMPAFVRLANEAKAAGVKIALDHGRVNEGITEEEKETVRQLALAADIYFPSADEFMQLWNVASIEEGLKLLNQKAPGTVTIVKNSNKGASVLVDGEVVTTPAFTVKPIHTIGAGDSFNAGVISAQYSGMDLPQTIVFGCATAALKISQKELPTFNEVTNFINAQSA